MLLWPNGELGFPLGDSVGRVEHSEPDGNRGEQRALGKNPGSVTKIVHKVASADLDEGIRNWLGVFISAPFQKYGNVSKKRDGGK
jgi:hypothetical protein